MATSFILSAARTPIGKLLGNVSTLTAPQLGAEAIRAAMKAAGVTPDQVEEVIMGNVLSAGVGQAPARQAALLAGCPPTVAAVTINKVCGSGLKAVMLADQAIRAGDAKLIVAGGMENMTRAPHLLLGSRSGWKFGDQTMVDSMSRDGLWCATENVAMGCLSDHIAREHNVSRAAQDEFAVESHRRAVAAAAEGKFQNEMVPLSVSTGKTTQQITADEGPRADTALASLAKLRPAFGPEGTATAGNASQISDGGAAVVVASEEVAREINTPVKARILAAATSGVAPKDLFIAPVLAMQKVLAKANLTVADIDLFEINEAFAAQCLACMQPLQIPHAKVNVNGGAIALGHPIGASGGRVLVTLLHALADRKLKRGLATLCLGGGNAVAMIVERAT